MKILIQTIIPEVIQCFKTGKMKIVLHFAVHAPPEHLRKEAMQRNRIPEIIHFMNAGELLTMNRILKK